MAEQESKIYAYGFDKAGFEISKSPLSVEHDTTIEFVAFDDTNAKMDEADAVIIPQGIFEDIVYQIYVDVKVRRDLLLERQRELLNLLRTTGKWVCFLVGCIQDRVARSIDDQDLEVEILDTDLCKRLLNLFEVKRTPAEEGFTLLEVAADEFRQYVTSYGVAKTIFTLPASSEDMRSVVTIGGVVVGFEYSRKLFFLPFHTVRKDWACAQELVKSVYRAIVAYRQKRQILLPPWLEGFQFHSEAGLTRDIDALLERLGKLQKKLEIWKQYKAVLTTSGDILREVVVRVLREFFGLNVLPSDEGVEDAKVLDDKNEPLGFVEVKGTNKGVKREYINQVDSQRERGGLSVTIPSVLVINNQMNLKGIQRRLETKVAEEHVKHARKMNILIIRSIDLLCFMRLLEGEPESARREKFLNLLNSGGGWLRATSEGCEITCGNAM